MQERDFASWMAKVDKFLQQLCGMSSADMADVCYADMFADGTSPKAAARRAIRNEQGFDD